MSNADAKKVCQKLLVENLSKIFREAISKIPNYGGRVENQSEIVFSSIPKFNDFVSWIIHQSSTEATKVLITYELTKKVREMQQNRKHQIVGDAMPGAENLKTTEKEDTIIRQEPDKKETPATTVSSIPS